MKNLALPSLGDVVNYRNKNMIVVDISNNPGYYIFFLFPEEDFNESSFVESLKLIRKSFSLIIDYDSTPEEIPFTIISSSKYKISRASYTTIEKS